MMPFAAAISTHADTQRAFEEVASELASQVPNADLAVVCYSPHHLDRAPDSARILCDRLQPKTMLGCVGEAIAGGDREIEARPAVSGWCARWGDAVHAESFHLNLEETPDGFTLLGWPDSALEPGNGNSAMIVFGDPYSFPADRLFLPQVNADQPGVPVVGGMASGMPGPGSAVLIRDGQAHLEGAVGVSLTGRLTMRTIVSQGCRPIGKPFVVTRCDGAIITGLGGKTPMDQLREMWPQLPQQDRDLFQRGPHLGLVINEYKESFGRGDFLIRNIAGLDSNSGALAIMDVVRLGQTVQFHVRDAAAADEDLNLLLGETKSTKAGGALLFTCNGRGSRLFGKPDHDAAAIQRHLGPIPLAGMFCAGEIGPVGGKNFIHGFTASIAVFEES